MADQAPQPPPVVVTQGSVVEDVPDGEHPLGNTTEDNFSILDWSQSPSRHAWPRSGPHPPPQPEDVMDPQGESPQSAGIGTPQSVMNGLKLKLQGQQNPFASFTYTLFPLMDKCVPVDWKILATEDVQSQHIRCHELLPKDDLAMLVANFKQAHAKAVILINTQENYSIAPQFLEGMEKSNFPILVLTRDDGGRLLKDLDQYGDDVLARVDAESQVDVQLARSGPAAHVEHSPTAGRRAAKLSIEKEGPGLRQRVKAALGLDKPSTIDLKAELKKLMFTLDKRPIPICEDQAKFTMIMAAFSNYEKQAKAESNHQDINETLKKIRIHFDELFIEDFPLYIIIAFRIHLRSPLYICDEMKAFIAACLNKLESLKYTELARVFTDFVKRGDFNVMSGITKEEESRSVFWILESACLELSEVSFKLQNRVQHQQDGRTGQRPLYPKFCYARMMWISLALRLRCERSIITRTNVWYDRFIQHHSRIVMNDITIKEIKDGLELCRLLQLPQDVTFSSLHMTNLLVSDRCIRPFRHVRNYVCCVERFLDSEDNVYIILTHIRAIYESKMNEPDFSLASVSIGGTLADTITEGIRFLDAISALWDRRKFSDVAIDSECIKWLQLLLGLVDITGDHPDVHLKKFLGRTGVVKKYRTTNVKQIMETTKTNFHRLSIQQFYPLYKAFRIWPNKFLEEYLKSYTVPSGMKISDGTCNEFFSEVVTRFPAAHEHYYLQDFLLKIAERYRTDGCAGTFVLDLLQLGVPKLFAAADGSNDGDVREAKEVQKDFMGSLRNFIRGNALKQTILGQMTDILNAISDERDEFQLLILTILHQEVIPEFKALQELESNSARNFRAVLKYSIDYLRRDLGWLQALTAKQAFCWGLVTSCCSRVRVVPDHFEWLHNYSYVISELSKIFNAYCTGKKLSEEESVIVNVFPEDVELNHSDDVKRYFEWICTIQSMFKVWQDKFKHMTANYDEILVYAACHIELEKLSHTVCATSLVIDFQEIQNVKNTFLTEFELLNVYLLRYIPQHPDAKWCTFPALLNEYGVALPQTLFSPIQKYIVFPDKENATGDELLIHPLPAGTNGQFQPGLDISLKLSQQFSLRDLSALVQALDHFQRPLIAQMDMLIFFKLNHSVMFDKYLRLQIRQVSEEEAAEESANEPQFSMAMSAFRFSVPVPSLLQPKKQSRDGLTVKVLLKSLEKTQQLLHKIMNGEAAYSDIIAEGELDLEKLNIEKEFTTLRNYSITLHRSQANFEGLVGVRSLLELFQYTKHVQNIHGVCEQYQLEGCLHDPELKELQALVDKLESEEDRSRLTPNEASEKMKRVKELLCINEHTSSHCLDIFSTVADSAEFYQFVRDKQFHGEKGAAVFRQQYQLITAQLQHEEYDESVLNHLLAAFKVITPFMNSKQTFSELMTNVTSLDTTIGLKQLETVNGNITLIRLWFSRAEGDTLQNVAKELDKVLETGYYMFKLPQDSAPQMLFEYIPSSTQPASLEEMVDGGGTGLTAGGNAKTVSRHSTRLDSRGEQDGEQGKASKLERWNQEQIADFARKLGFIDTEKEGGEKIKHYRHIGDVANKLLELYVRLKELGNPRYFKGTIDPLLCSIGRQEADHRVQETAQTLDSWRNRVIELRSQYDWLLFFSIPKILRLYKMLSDKEQYSSLQLDRIVHEISFLCKNDKPTRRDLGHNVQRELGNCLKDIESDDPPMHVVGRFLALLFTNHKLPTRSDLSLPRHRSLTSLSLSHDFTQLLHYCPGFTQGQLIQTVIGICSGIPEAFEVFHCRPTTTEGELTLFLKRSAKHRLRSLVLEVNRLPFKLQESLMQFDLLIRRDVQSQKDSVEEPSSPGRRTCGYVHFIETAPSVLRDVPWIQLREHKEPELNFEKARTICTSRVALPDDFVCIQLVVGAAGDGKTHYIKEQLNNSPAHLTIAVNEAFTPLKAISKLRTNLPLNQRGVSIFFNFTMLPPGDSVDDSECERYQQLMEVIGWFFFDLLILGYVEDPVTGKSFRIPGGLQWAIYIEVPSREKNMTSGEALKQFRDEVPALGLLGTQHFVHHDKPYTVDDDVQLVCKYLKALRLGERKGIDRLYKEGHKLVKFSQEPDLTVEQCQRLLQEYMPEHIRSTKITQRLFVKYMKRRCQFLDTLPAFNYNTGFGEYTFDDHGKKIVTSTQQLGSTLMNAMLKEVSDFCDPDIKENWSVKPHQQLIYDYKDRGASFGLISLHPHQLHEADKAVFKRIGVKIPSMGDLYSRKSLDDFLSRALNIQLENNRLTAIDDSAYVLTLDYTIKMLNIHERYECGVPVIIEGETGVGKTALIEMLSKLWNQSLLLEWKKQRDRVVEFFVRKMGEIPADISDNYQACVQAVQCMSAGQSVSEDTLLFLCQLPDGTHGRLHADVQKRLKPMRNDPVVAQLTLKDFKDKEEVSLEQLFIDADMENTPEATAKLLHAVLSAQIKPTFHKINVHAAMTPADIEKLFQPVFSQAEELKDAFDKSKQRAERNLLVNEVDQLGRRSSTGGKMVLTSIVGSMIAQTATVLSHGAQSLSAEEKPNIDFSHKMPFVTVFLDEVNTSSCVGLFKEIIVDRTFDGVPIPENVFIVAACNPHRGNSMASLGVRGADKEKEKWVRGTYYVRKLHPTLQFLMWDYGSLDEHQEKEYINAKMKMLNKKMPNPEVASLTDLIVGSQNKMRHFAYEQISKNMTGSSRLMVEHFSRISSRSCVSQRDIQRVFTLYQWFMKIYNKMKPHGDRPDYSRRAVLVALGIVYYMRLNNTYRTQYSEFLDKPEFRLPNEVTFTKAFEQELNWYIEKVELPKGIARTQALKENIFATIVCTVTHTPLIIVGAPGSSKTLSFNQTIANLKGAESRMKLFRDTSIFHSLDPHYYQCSRRTTSNEIQTVFSRAINRQRSHSRFKLPIYCVVFMDEAGLPEESHESLKVLHYHLDKQEVSFVAITNHVLDAAKTNRAVSLFRPEASNEDLHTLAKGCLCSNPENPPPELMGDLATVVRFCAPYSTLMEGTTFARFFGLRDFIQFVNYLRRKRDDNQDLTPQVVMHALERNFNGTEDFEKICSKFLGSNVSKVKRRGILDILRDSLEDRPQAKQDHSENEVRYKLIIDPSEDDSIVRLLFSFGILKRDSTRIFVCSNIPGDGQLQKINTIAAIRHSAIEGHTVVMSQTDDIHESFYDLFNQRFRRIDDPKEGPRYYTNIAIGAHLRPSRVHPNFQCVVVVKKSEVKNTPAPFLNRFEKYLISHCTLLETALERMPPSMGSIVRAAMEKVQDFISLISGPDSLYGFCPDTLNSLVLALLPSVDHVYEELGELSLVDNSKDVKFYILQEIVLALRECSGFFVSKYTEEEFSLDVESIFDLVLQDPKFKGLMKDLTHDAAAQAIPEAINVLHSDVVPDQGGHLDVSPEGCLIIALLQQWLVRHLCKRLMQLMTSEALILHRNKIPFSYMRDYLNFHTHFSLQNLVEKYHQAAESTREESPSCRSATKVLCFTRSSPLIHQLPAEFPSSSLRTQMDTRLQEILEDFVFVETDKLMVYKLSTIHSQIKIQDVLRNFLKSETAEVCLLVVNMQETSKEVVNHVRIMIEETETTVAKQMTKTFIVLLHFPPSQFFHPCYPSLFLQGWDHCYLDTIAHSAIKGVVDIRDWFWQCCFPQQSSQLVEDEDALLQALQEMLPQVIPILASRVFFGSRQNGSFNSPMNGLQRSEVLGELLFRKGKEGDTVGKVLCERFRTYWKPSVMAEQLERAAVFSRNRESTLNITESIQANFKSLFFDYLVYMVSRINANFNIDIIFNLDCTPAVEELFLEIVRVFPTPKFSQINLLSSHLPQPKPLVYIPRFPFFQLVCQTLEKVVEESREAANVGLDIISEETSAPDRSIDLSIRSSISPQDILGGLQQAVTTRIKDKVEGSAKQTLSLVAEAMSKDDDLWVRYFNDYVLHELRLDSEDSSSGIAQQILHTFLGQLHQLESLERIVGLHSYLHVYQLDLAKMASVLRPLNKLQKLHQVTARPTLLSPFPPASPSRKLLTIVKQTQHPFGSPEHLATFVVATLFDALVGFLYPTKSTLPDVNDKMAVWYRVYRDVMTLPNLKQYIYSALGDKSPEMTCVEARLNLMQVTFLVLQTSHELDDDVLMKGQQVFRTLFSRYFNEKSELKQTSCPRLAAVSQVSIEVVSRTGFSLDPNRDNEDVRVIIEGLFAHFFSPERQSHHRGDIQWFLELANEQKEWGAFPFEEGAGVVSGSLNEDLFNKMEESILDPKTNIPGGAVSMNVFKLYLGRILGQCNQRLDTEAMKSGPLLLYHHSTRTEIGTVLSASPDLGPPGPFIPKFYRDCSSINLMPDCENARMQQSLAHLYFLTVLEHLMSKPYKLSGLVRMASNISNLCASPSTCDRDRVILWIELQAVVQVVAQQLALHLDPSEPEKIGEVVNIADDLNRLMDDVSTGGGRDGGHGMVVALHLYKLLKSSRRFTDLIVKKYDSVIRGINCLEPFYDQLKAPKEPKAHLFPFMMPAAEGELASIYNQVLKTMLGIHNRTEQVENLKRIAEGERSSSLERKNSFRMMIWLVSYYEFFDKKMSSLMLCNIVGGPEMSPYLKEEGYIRLIQCFLCPDLMLNRKEVPNVLREDQAVLELTSDGRHRPIRRGGNEMDPVHDLFVPENPEQQDQSDADLRHSLANMVATVMGCPTRSNHLWYHLFAPENLVNTYITGFMYDTKISPEGLLYDCGVELTAEGEIGRQDYNKHAGRGTYTLHSLYLLLWSNFGAFCMALLTQPDADAKIHGPIISDWQSIRHYCVSQLRTVWQHMRNNLGLSEEERTFFVTRCLKNFHKLITGPHDSVLPPQLPKTGTIVKDSLRGVFKTREELDGYEKMWHCCVYQPTWNELKNKFAEYSHVWQDLLFIKLRSLDRHYPHFPSEMDFVHRILSYGDLEQHSEGGTLRGLSQFAQGWRRLQAGGLLLPDLVELYRWLHNQLAHLVTYERTTTLSIYKVVHLAARRYGSPMGEYIVNLYERVKKGYNDYVDLIGGAIGAGACAAIKQGNRVYTIADDIPLLHFLTDVEEEEQGNDWLFTVIAEIVLAHNMAMEAMYTVIQASYQSTLARLLPEQPAKVFPTEVNERNCFIGSFTRLHGVNSLLQVIRSRYQPIAMTPPDVTGPSMSFSHAIHESKKLPEFQLLQLEEDLVRIFVAGKPLIESPSSIRILFKFKQSQKPANIITDDVVQATLDLEDIDFRLPDDFKETLTDNLQKRFEYEFHSASYNEMIEVITALRTVCGHLVKVILEETHLNDDEEDLDTLTLPRFMIAYVYEHLTDPNKVLAEIGITPNSLKHSQLTCLIELPLPYVFSCLQQFVRLVDEGVYDFCSLPFALKTHMTERDTRFIEQELRDLWTGSHGDLVTEVKQLIEVLKHSEMDITKRVNEEASRKPIIGYLKMYLMVGEDDKLPPLIPETILLQHYMHFRLALRRLLLNLRLGSARETVWEGNTQANQWSEFVDDLWDVRLPHLREETYGDGGFVYDPATGLYGFQEGSEDGSEEELMFDLMNDQEDGATKEGGVDSYQSIDYGEGAEEDSFAVISESVGQQATVAHSYDLGQSTDEESENEDVYEVSESPRQDTELKSRFKQDPDFQKKVLSLAQSVMRKDKEVLAPRARTYTPALVGEFLTSIKLDKYRESFISNEVSGDVLLDADDEFLTELGVSTALDRVRIMTWFPRRLEEVEPKYPVSEVVKYLQENKLEKYIKLFEENEIDGDMLLDTDPTLMKAVLKEIGVGVVDRVKILSKFKTFASIEA